MKKVNIKKWGKYKVGDLFNLINSKAYHLNDIKEANFGLNYITRSKFNNGLKSYVIKKDGYQVNPAGTISFGAENANFFYQENEYITGNKMYYIDTRKLSKYSALFLRCVLEKTFTNDFSFSDGMIPDKIKNEYIYLPKNNQQQPDWAYMESYMKSIMLESEKKLENLQNVNSNNNKVESAKWKDFIFGKIFQMQKQKEISPIYAYNKNMQQEIKYPFYGQSSENNGIISYISLEDRTLLNNKENNPIIMIHSNNHLSFYVNSPFYLKDGHGATSLFTNKNLNEYNVFFIISVLNKTMADKFDYSLKATKEKLNSLKIKLPVDGEGEPDWEYMENYMKNIMQESEWNIQKLQKLDCCK